MMQPQQQVIPGQSQQPGQVLQGGQILQQGQVIQQGQNMQTPQMQQMQTGHGMQPQASTTSTSKETSQPSHLQKWEADEPLGDAATIAMILYANINHASLKVEHPNWGDRIKQIAKIWKNLPTEKRAPYVTKARENRTANRMNRGPSKTSRSRVAKRAGS